MLPEAFKDFVDGLLNPTTVFFTATVGFALMILLRGFWTRGWVAGSILVFVVVAYCLSLSDADFVKIVAKPATRRSSTTLSPTRISKTAGRSAGVSSISAARAKWR